MPGLENLPVEIQRSRRNLVKIGAIAASAIFASLTETRPAAARPLRLPHWPPTGGPPHWLIGGPPGLGGGGPPGLGGGGPPDPHCFLKGTTIRTAEGDRKIEDLAAGDLLPTVFGGICPIQSIERYTLTKGDPVKAWGKDAWPVRVARSALGPDVPHADLYVTKAHALLIDGVLVTAGSLINGTTITLYDPREFDQLEFFHITLARHDVIHAEGAPCETLLDTDQNAVDSAGSLRQYGSLMTREAPCAPLLCFNGSRSEIRSRFRSAISPWIDRRQKLDIIRDRLEERGIALLRQSALMS